MSFPYTSERMCCRCFWESRVYCMNSASRASGDPHFSSKLHLVAKQRANPDLDRWLWWGTQSLTSHVQVTLSETKKPLFTSACDDILIKDGTLLSISCHPIPVASIRKLNKLEEITSRAWCCMPAIPAFRSRLGSLQVPGQPWTAE